MEEIIFPYKPRPLQAEMHDALEKQRFGVAVCHRRFGKTVFAVMHLLRSAVTSRKERPRFGYIGPTYRQAKQNAWDYLCHYSSVAGRWREVNISELRVDFPHNSSQVRLYGADNPDSLRGLGLDGVVLDEYGLMPRNIWSEVIRPALADRIGWALFIGTPNGKNQFYELIHGDNEGWIGAKHHPDWYCAEHKASETGYLSREELASAKAGMTADEYAQEFECSFEAAVKGAIYAKELEKARSDKRITSVPYEPALPVDTDWDLGYRDATAVWFSQSTRGGEIRLIDYLEGEGEGFPFYAKKLAEKGYIYGKHWAPHDIAVHEMDGRSRQAVAASYGVRFDLVDRVAVGTGDELEEGIHAARMIFSRCWFDAEKCKAGIEALMGYRRDYNQRLGEFKATPVHDWASHGADAFRGLAVRHQTPREQQKGKTLPMPKSWNWA